MTDNSQRMERRQYIGSSLTGAIMMISGCTTTIDDLISPVNSGQEGNNPWGKNRLSVGLSQQVNPRHDIHEIVRSALQYWEDNLSSFAGYRISFDYQPNTNSPDIQVVLVDEIRYCGNHSGEYAGCIEFSENGNSRSAEIRIEDGYRKEWMTNLLRHELGHALGLEHGDEPAHIMSADMKYAIPDYQKRVEAIDNYDDAFEPYNRAMEAWSDGVDFWSDEVYESARRSFEDAHEYYNRAEDFVFRAKQIARDIGEERAARLLNEPLDKLRLRVDQANLAVDMTEAGLRDEWDRADQIREEVNELNQDANRHAIDKYDQFVMALGFPDPSS